MKYERIVITIYSFNLLHLLSSSNLGNSVLTLSAEIGLIRYPAFVEGTQLGW